MSDTRYISAPGEIQIDTAAIPAYTRDRLAAATLDLFHAILRQPGGREALDARTAARKAAAAATKKEETAPPHRERPQVSKPTAILPDSGRGIKVVIE